MHICAKRGGVDHATCQCISLSAKLLAHCKRENDAIKKFIPARVREFGINKVCVY